MATELKRTIGVVSLSLYGIGVTIGAGIFVLVGEVTGAAGPRAPLAFLLAGLVAGVSALSYAELATRFPVSAGEARYVGKAFGSRRLSQLVGYSVVSVGILSSATIMQGFSGYAEALLGTAPSLSITLACGIMILLVIAGARESVWAAGVLTLVEIGLLTYVVSQAAPTAITAPVEAMPFPTSGIFLGAAIAFFAFIGFEDIVNMAEDAVQPRRTIPLAILITLLVTTAIYIIVVLVATRAVPPSQLAASPDPMIELLRVAGSEHTALVSSLAMLAIVNGALVQIIMGSRVLFGMARSGDTHPAFGELLERRRTPAFAICTVGLIILVLALTLPLSGLARATSFVTLSIFALVNLSLIRIRRQHTDLPATFNAPSWAPVAGIVGSLLLIAFAAFG